MDETVPAFLAKADECLTGAEIAYTAGRYNNSANRCYYACFHAARAALVHENIRPPRRDWGHEFVQARFAGILIQRRKLYCAEFRRLLAGVQAVRNIAGYSERGVTSAEINAVIRQTRGFVRDIRVNLENA